MLTPEEQARLAERIVEGEADAEEALAATYRRRIFLTLQARLRERDVAEELTQDTLIAIITALRRGQLRSAESLSAFVHGIARNLANNYLRTRRDLPVIVELAPGMDPAVAPDDFEGQERLRLVREALGQLDPADRAVLLRTLDEGLKPGEIARDLGLTAEVVRTRKSRALKRLIDEVRRVSRSTGSDHIDLRNTR